MVGLVLMMLLGAIHSTLDWMQRSEIGQREGIIPQVPCRKCESKKIIDHYQQLFSSIYFYSTDNLPPMTLTLTLDL